MHLLGIVTKHHEGGWFSADLSRIVHFNGLPFISWQWMMLNNMLKGLVKITCLDFALILSPYAFNGIKDLAQILFCLGTNEQQRAMLQKVDF